ncbi:hypothetical protein [Kribbella deserti]|uniref:Uncharacterized protein n=1 Tax=Kribbella deserti TaxID=1926257 RepID=A0ABV6QLE3_9ACTN
MGNSVRRAVATAATAVVVAVTGGQSPASATAQWDFDWFRVCVDQAASMCVAGHIEWGNRTSKVAADITNNVAGGIATVRWDAFANSTKIDSATSTVPARTAEVNFTLGDPDLPGGVNRIRIQICSSPTRCSIQWNEIRD